MKDSGENSTANVASKWKSVHLLATIAWWNNELKDSRPYNRKYPGRADKLPISSEKGILNV